MITINATIPIVNAPSWAIWQRRLLETMSQSVYPFLSKYTREDGTLIWRDEHDDSYQSRDGADDFYESFYNWALLYLLGGSDDLLRLAHRQWDAVTNQLTRLGLVYKEYEKGYDQFHQGESYIYFYFLCLADPTHPRLIERAKRFAGFYLNEDPEAQNYDPDHDIIRAPHNGSGGPRWGYFDGKPYYGWYSYMEPYGLPFEDVEGISDYEDLKDPLLAERMGQVMEERYGKGDSATNLIVTSLITNAFLLTGEVGEYVGGKWYGGLYGWSWPHGYYNIGMAAVVAGTNAYLMTGDTTYLDLPRSQIDAIHQLGQTFTLGALAKKYGRFWVEMVKENTPETEIFVVPYRYSDSGWFDYQSPMSIYPIALWNLTFQPDDWARVEFVRKTSSADWKEVLPFRNKEDAGHEQPWTCFLKGENPGYPEAILSESYFKVARRMDLIRHDDLDLTQVSIHHWQELNPVTTEALVQLTLGAPQIIYNGGLLLCQVRYFDVERHRPGLPLDVAALVEQIESAYIVVRLVNLSVLEGRDLIIQAGGFGEHQFISASYGQRISVYPGIHGPGGYAAPTLRTEDQTAAINDHLLRITMPPASEIRLKLEMKRFVNTPSYRLPWDQL